MRTWLEMIDELERLTNELKDKWGEEMKAGGLVPIRPKGKWIDYKCSNCKEFALQWGDESMAESNFCPHCGAEMVRGEQE